MNWYKSLSLLALAAVLGLPLQAAILATGDIRGEIKPCGCSADGDLGGIERMSSFLLAQNNALWVDLGNFSAPATPQGQLKTRLLIRHFQVNGLKLLLPGPLEFQTGVADLASHQLPYLLSNSQNTIPGVKPALSAGGLTWVGFLSPSSLYQGAGSKINLLEAKAFTQTLPPQAANRALLFRGPTAELEEILKTHAFALVILANDAPEEAQQKLEQTLAGKAIPTPPLKGQGVLAFAAPGQPAQLHWLDKSFANDPRFQKDFTDYDKAVEGLFMAYLAGTEAQEKRVYKGAGACVSCHQKEGATWQATRHAKALVSLQKVGKQFDPECIGCHVQGFGQGGYRDEATTPDLAHVGCENCHGPYQPHETGWKNRAKVGEAACKTCHQGSHSPRFRFQDYYPKIAHER